MNILEAMDEVIKDIDNMTKTELEYSLNNTKDKSIQRIFKEFNEFSDYIKTSCDRDFDETSYLKNKMFKTIFSES